MATESQSPTYSDLSTFRECISGLSNEIAGAGCIVRDASRMRAARPECASLFAKVAFACAREQALLLRHIWSGKFAIDRAMEIATSAIAGAGATLAFLDPTDEKTERAMRVAQSIATHAMEHAK